MQAVEISAYGGPENLGLCTRLIPTLSENQVLIKVSYSGVNRPDLLQRQGNYKVPETASDLPGLEVSGIVVALNGSIFALARKNITPQQSHLKT